MFRLQVSFTHRKDSLLARIRDKNAGLYAFLDRSSQLSRSSTTLPANRKTTKKLRPVMTLQQCGTALYRSLQRQWCCACPLGHHFGITVEKSGGAQAGSSLHFQLLFWEQITPPSRSGPKFYSARPIHPPLGAFRLIRDRYLIQVLNIPRQAISRS
jgi:hypothetical protein